PGALLQGGGRGAEEEGDGHPAAGRRDPAPGRADGVRATPLSRRISPMRTLIAVGLAFGLVGPAAAQDKKADPKPPDVKDPALRAELVKRMKAEQDARIEVMRVAPPGKPLTPEDREKPEVKAAMERMGTTDKENLAWFKGVVDKHGWPGK